MATDSIWGVVDMIPETNFPDIRACCLINSDDGQRFSIPREKDMVRLYIQLLDNALGSSTGRVDRNKISPEKLIDVCFDFSQVRYL
jgi:phenol 2-monooxygenase (NADPH)